jgi:hypothetical protein
MGTLRRSWLKLMLLPFIAVAIGCKPASYISDNKKRKKRLEHMRTKYDTPGQARVKTGNLNDGY